MSTEVEAKFRITDPRPLRDHLLQHGTVHRGCVLEVNRIFDTPDRRLLNADCGLRIRECISLDVHSPCDETPRALLTHKGPRQATDIKIRPELETLIDDPRALTAIFEHLGLRPVVVYEKRRETFRLGSCEVTLDELPRLGWWMEIEGPDAGEVHAARARLPLGDSSPFPQPSVELAALNGYVDDAGCHWLLFDDGRPPPNSIRPD